MSLKSFAAASSVMVGHLEDVAAAVRATRSALDSGFPLWLQPRQKWPTEFLRHDARSEFFVTLGVVLRNAQLSYHFIATRLATASWWQHNGAPGQSSADQLQVVREYALSTKLACILGVAIATEETVRAIVRSGPFGIKVGARTAFYTLYVKLLASTGLRRYRKLFDVLRLIRNTQHTNGIYSDERKKRVVRTYKGQIFRFDYGKPLTWLDESTLVWLLQEIHIAMQDVVTHRRVIAITNCPREP